MKRILLATALAFSCYIGTTSAGVLPDDSRVASRSDSDCARARKAGRPCKLVFDGDTVDGDRPAGDGDNIAVATQAQFGNLISIRRSFREMIIKSADQIW